MLFCNLPECYENVYVSNYIGHLHHVVETLVQPCQSNWKKKKYFMDESRIITAHNIKSSYVGSVKKLRFDCQQLSRHSHQSDADPIGQDVTCKGMWQQQLIYQHWRRGTK